MPNEAKTEPDLRAPQPPPSPAYCTWCGYSDQEVFTLIAGPAHNICNNCVADCQRLIAQRSAEGRGPNVVAFARRTDAR